MNGFTRYFSDFFKALRSLLIGMKTTLKIFFRKKTTELYPEKRDKLYVSPLFRGMLQMIHTPDNYHHCVACGLCQINCPNGTIHIESQTVTDADGKKSKELLTYSYDLGKCLFCELCVRNCPHHAIEFVNRYENAVFTRDKLKLTLNHPGSRLMPKPAAPARPAAQDTTQAAPDRTDEKQAAPRSSESGTESHSNQK